eukprot:CAMPEP_0119399096 /NCGR_PEP_ID=MMETSP1334-20130426/141184_1 /TAXON_ID=127549 /ORGANISM="Calcidiscus leptoporus, Strain RCC1130" /LENGTH=225 /DNA_ID=CAMNT_0007422981 /DNA_START=279 /DNA_END=957 /DNA_ORIENTATION=+
MVAQLARAVESVCASRNGVRAASRVAIRQSSERASVRAAAFGDDRTCRRYPRWSDSRTYSIPLSLLCHRSKRLKASYCVSGWRDLSNVSVDSSKNVPLWSKVSQPFKITHVKKAALTASRVLRCNCVTFSSSEALELIWRKEAIAESPCNEASTVAHGSGHYSADHTGEKAESPPAARKPASRDACTARPFRLKASYCVSGWRDLSNVSVDSSKNVPVQRGNAAP